RAPAPGAPLDGPAVGRPDTTASVEVAVLLTATEGPFLTPATPASGEQDQPVRFPSQGPPLPTTGEDAAPTLVADDKRREAQTTPVLDMVFRDLGLLEKDMLNDPVPALRPRQWAAEDCLSTYQQGCLQVALLFFAAPPMQERNVVGLQGAAEAHRAQRLPHRVQVQAAVVCLLCPHDLLGPLVVNV